MFHIKTYLWSEYKRILFFDTCQEFSILFDSCEHVLLRVEVVKCIFYFHVLESVSVKCRLQTRGKMQTEGKVTKHESKISLKGFLSFVNEAAMLQF